VHDELVEPARSPQRGLVSALISAAGVIVTLIAGVTAAVFDREGTAGAGGFAGALTFTVAVGLTATVGAVMVLAEPKNHTGWLLLSAVTVLSAGVAMTEAGVHGVITDTGSVPGVVPGRGRARPPRGRLDPGRHRRAGRVPGRSAARTALAMARVVCGRGRDGPVPR
jgi:hypothetical protein